MRIRPIGNNVMVKYPSSGRFEDGVWVESESDARMDAVVVAVGHDVSSVRVGDSVVCDRTCGRKGSFYGVDIYTVSEDDVLAIIPQ